MEVRQGHRQEGATMSEIERLKLHLAASIGTQLDMERLIQAIKEVVLDPYSIPFPG